MILSFLFLLIFSFYKFLFSSAIIFLKQPTLNIEISEESENYSEQYSNCLNVKYETKSVLKGISDSVREKVLWMSVVIEAI